MQQSTRDEVLTSISTDPKVLVLIEKSDDLLCKKARQALLLFESKLKSAGFTLLFTELEEDCSIEQLACNKLPQLRVFKRNELKMKYIGVPPDKVIQDIIIGKFE